MAVGVHTAWRARSRDNSERFSGGGVMISTSGGLESIHRTRVGLVDPVFLQLGKHSGHAEGPHYSSE